jgi:hypothetical protein
MLDSQSSRKVVVAVGLAVVFGALIFEFVVPNEHVGQVAQSSRAPAVPPQAALANDHPTVSTPGTAKESDKDVSSAQFPSETPATTGAPADAQQAPASPAAAGNEPAASDSQITADVKSHIAVVAPDNNVHVTTTNGVVALAGSAPSQDAVDQAKLAAFRVAGVKDVDVAALKVSGQLR